MIIFLYKLIILALSITITYICYLRIDKRYDITKKICLNTHIKQRWLAFLWFCCSMIIILIVAITGIITVSIPYIVIFLLAGILTGISVGMKNSK